jgi:hypothetical protein
MTKAAEHKSVATTTAKSNKPFFNKGEGSALSLVSETEQPFFQKNNIPSIQAKLNIGQPTDKYEQEADAVADKTVRKISQPETIQKKTVAPVIPITTSIQAKCAHEAIQEKGEDEQEEGQLEMQRKAITEAISVPPPPDDNKHSNNDVSPVQLKCNKDRCCRRRTNGTNQTHI